MITRLLVIAIPVVALATAFWTNRYVSRGYEAQMAQQQAQAMAKQTELQRQLNAASAAFEEAKKARRVVYRDRVQTVEKIVERPVYRDTVCLDPDGLRILNDAIGAAAGPR